jgi:hypothetical protein
LLRGFIPSESGVLALGGAYEAGTSGSARLLRILTAGIPAGERADPAPVVNGNPFRIGEAVEFGDPQGGVDTHMVIVDVRGRVVFRAHKTIPGRLTWTGLTQNGPLAAPGTYFYFLSPSSRRGKLILVR